MLWRREDPRGPPHDDGPCHGTIGEHVGEGSQPGLPGEEREVDDADGVDEVAEVEEEETPLNADVLDGAHRQGHRAVDQVEEGQRAGEGCEDSDEVRSIRVVKATREMRTRFLRGGWRGMCDAERQWRDAGSLVWHESRVGEERARLRVHGFF